MQFSIAMIALFASSVLAVAVPAPATGLQARNLHQSLYCVDVTPAKNFRINESAKNNDAATEAACNAYKRRSTGTQMWDTCPDCIVGNNGGSGSGYVTFCRSAAGHLGGDEMTYYCKQAGADRAAA